MIRLLVTVGVLLSVSARAESGLGTRSFMVREEHRGDRLTGCAIDFTQILQDIEYADGGFVQLRGTIALAQRAGELEGTLKLAPGDLRLTGGELSVTPFAPFSAAIVGGDFTTLGHEAAGPPCDGIGFCASYRDDETLSGLMTVLADPDGFRIAYRRHSQGLEVTTTVVGDPSLATFGDCVLSLFGGALGSPPPEKKGQGSPSAGDFIDPKQDRWDLRSATPWAGPLKGDP